ncbi:hypothetical protein SteCoe_29167 [Stentor coeruleus]|uniref:Uncharacterized protein n=1 Tax=Stentor coeruleus TaxID=5963 RepID=A0A1R2B6H2_9CILI|nr:hypothetical protein SteCoe_29167 [Stentor coeruleus]
MYNSYLHDIKQKKSKAVINEIEKSARTLQVQQKMRDKLLKKYKVRIVQRVFDLATDPVPIYNREQFQTPKYLGESSMRLKPRDSKARIDDALSKNTIFDLQPIFSPINEFRTRKKDKEIQAYMKFTPKDRYERLVDKWVSDKEIIYSWEINKKSLSKSPIRNKTKKVYYKTVESAALNVSPESCSKDTSLVHLHNVSEESIWEDLNANTDEKIGILAQSALEKCKLRPSKAIRYRSSTKERLN